MDTNPDQDIVEQEPTEQNASIVDEGSQASPEELGVGKRQSNEPFSPINFEQIIDKAMDEKKAADENPPEKAVDENKEPSDKKEEIADLAKIAKGESPEETPKEEKTEEPKAEDKKEEVVEKSKIDEIEAKLGQNASPKTKKLFNEVKEQVAREKTEREKVAKELADVRTQFEELKKNSLPKEVSEEMAELRDRLRKFDANADPEIINKYDKKMSANSDNIIETLTKNGLPKEHADKLKANGVTMATLKPYLDTLETGKGADGNQYDADPDTAELVRESLRENLRLAKDKDREISDWRAGYETRTKQTEEKQKADLENASQRLSKEFEGHLGKWDFLKKPTDISDSDIPAVRKQKEQAIREYNESGLKFAETIKKETGSPLDTQITARVGILYRDHIAPKLANQLQASQKEIETLRSQLANMRKAGSASKTIGTSNVARTKVSEPQSGAGFDDILDSMTADAMASKSSE